MEESENRKTLFTVGGPGLFNTMFIVFLTLKLCKVIDWSWWWVTAPLWAPFCLVVVLAAVSGIGVFICDLISRRRRW